jgi:hypothetical protein
MIEMIRPQTSTVVPSRCRPSRQHSVRNKEELALDDNMDVRLVVLAGSQPHAHAVIAGPIATAAKQSGHGIRRHPDLPLEVSTHLPMS